MDELEISGKRYISTRRAGKEHKYHSDYIGQLIRGGKVVGQKVGRSWYVDEQSLAAYLGKEVKGSPTTAAPISVSAIKSEDQLEVRAPMPSWRKIPEVAPQATIEKKVAAPQPTVAAEVAEVQEAVEESVEDAAVEDQTAEEIVEHKIEIRNPAKEEKKKNIQFVANDAPLFPAIKLRKQKEVVAPVVEEEPVEASDSIEEPDAADAPVRKTIRPLQYGMLGVLGVTAFFLVAGMSYMFSYKTIVEGDQMSASITLSN